MAIRVAITGRKATPPLFDVMVAIGYDTTIARLKAASELACHHAPRGLTMHLTRDAVREPGWTATSRPGAAATPMTSATSSARTCAYS